MLKNRFVNILLVLSLVLVLTLSVAGAALAAKPEQATLPTLKLTVTQSPLAIYPPIMIYTAQLSPAPTSSSTVLTVDFYNQIGGQMPPIQYLGSAPMDKTGKAVLNKQMPAGTYTAFAQVVIGTQTIVSNKVTYKVP
jgi:hypothetical protein